MVMGNYCLNIRHVAVLEISFAIIFGGFCELSPSCHCDCSVTVDSGVEQLVGFKICLLGSYTFTFIIRLKMLNKSECKRGTSLSLN